MKIAVIGANGRTGRIVVSDAVARGHRVVAVARSDQASKPDDDNLTTYGDLATALLDSLTRQDLCRHGASVANRCES